MATSAAYCANATDPLTMFLTEGPERYSAPPVETWMMPSEPASAKPLSAAFKVCEDDTLMAGNANEPAFAASSISAYFSGVAMGTAVTPRRNVRVHPTLVVTLRSPNRGAMGWIDNRSGGHPVDHT